MKSGTRRLQPLLLGAVLAVVLAVVLIRVRYQLEQVHQSLQLRTALETLALDLDAQLEPGARALEIRGMSAPREMARSNGVQSVWHAWRLDSAAWPDQAADNPPIQAAALWRALSERPATQRYRVLVGLFATATAGNAIVLAQPAAGSASVAAAPAAAGTVRWVGEWAYIDTLMADARIAALVKAGYRVQLYDFTAGAALYQTDPGALRASVTVPLPFRDSLLQLRAVARDPWGVALAALPAALLALLGIALWLSWQRHLSQALRVAVDDLADTEARRRELVGRYDQALENVVSLESRLQLVSAYDAATGLANRNSLLRRIDAALAAMRDSQHGCLCVMAVGFDHFDHITNSFGAEFASRVLVVAAERVVAVLPSKDLLFRTGDFNLCVVLPDADAPAAEQCARRILSAVESPIPLDGRTFMLHPSVGIAATQSAYEGPETLLDHARTALGAVPAEATARYCLFDSASARASANRLQLEADLDRAFDEGQFVLEFEPFVLPVAHTVVGFEALIRWDHPTEGRLSPGRFIPIALQAGMAHRLNSWVMRAAAQQAARWRRAGYPQLFVNFNLSAEAFLRPHLVEDVAALLSEFELPASQLVLELTESTLVQDMNGATRTLKDLADLGIAAWLDDFGTGYSSLSHLRALPLKGVKIDRSFIEHIDIDSRAFGFLKALIDLISYLGMQSIIEGIETPSQYGLLSLTTCDLYQGYHFARSMSAAQAERWMQERMPATETGPTLEPAAPRAQAGVRA